MSRGRKAEGRRKVGDQALTPAEPFTDRPPFPKRKLEQGSDKI